MALFYSDRTRCSTCHSGLTFSGPIRHRSAPDAAALFASNGLAPLDGEQGLMSATGEARDRHRFRAPTLRNVALTAPYMHDGRFATLEEVLAHYAAGGSPAASGAVAKLDLTPDEQHALLEFLRSLTDEAFVARDWARCGDAEEQ